MYPGSSLNLLSDKATWPVRGANGRLSSSIPFLFPSANDISSSTLLVYYIDENALGSQPGAGRVRVLHDCRVRPRRADGRVCHAASCGTGFERGIEEFASVCVASRKYGSGFEGNKSRRATMGDHGQHCFEI